jgi:hypothetical protein
VTSDAARFEDMLAVPGVWRFGVFQGLRRQQKGAGAERAKSDNAKGGVHIKVYLRQVENGSDGSLSASGFQLLAVTERLTVCD